MRLACAAKRIYNRERNARAMGALRHRGGIPPIVTVLVTIAAIVAASLVAWFMFVTTRSATNQPILEVTVAFASGNTVSITVRNIGSVDVPAGTASVTIKGSQATCNYPTIPKGGSVVCRATFTGITINDGDSGFIEIAGQALGFKVIVP